MKKVFCTCPFFRFRLFIRAQQQQQSAYFRSRLALLQIHPSSNLKSRSTARAASIYKYTCIYIYKHDCGKLTTFVLALALPLPQRHTQKRNFTHHQRHTHYIHIDMYARKIDSSIRKHTNAALDFQNVTSAICDPGK